MAASAALFLGMLVDDEYGDSHQAEGLYRQALCADDAETAVRATHRLGMLLAEQDHPEAEDLLRRAAHTDGETGAIAAARLGLLLQDRGDQSGALAAYGRAVEIGGDGPGVEFAREQTAALRSAGATGDVGPDVELDDDSPRHD
jgi:tetratricopeptide (TPR) repeat protein